MARYYFDFDDGVVSTRDEDGHDCDSREEVRRQALTTLPEIFRTETLDRDHRDFVVNVRDENGRYVFRAVMAITASWLDAARPSALKPRS